METFMKDAILFIHEYRNMESADIETGEFGWLDHAIPWQIDHQQIVVHP